MNDLKQKAIEKLESLEKDIIKNAKEGKATSVEDALKMFRTINECRQVRSHEKDFDLFGSAAHATIILKTHIENETFHKAYQLFEKEEDITKKKSKVEGPSL